MKSKRCLLQLLWLIAAGVLYEQAVVGALLGHDLLEL